MLFLTADWLLCKVWACPTRPPWTSERAFTGVGTKVRKSAIFSQAGCPLSGTFAVRCTFPVEDPQGIPEIPQRLVCMHEQITLVIASGNKNVTQRFLMQVSKSVTRSSLRLLQDEANLTIG